MRSCDPKEIDMRPLVIKTRSDPHPLVSLSGIAIIVFCGIGLYTLSNNNFDVFIGAIFTVVGYAFYKIGRASCRERV